MKPKFFFLHIATIMISSIMLFLFHLLSIAQPFIMIPNIPKTFVYISLVVGYAIGIFLLVMSITALYKLVPKEKLVT